MQGELLDMTQLPGKGVRRRLAFRRLLLQRLHQRVGQQHSQIEIIYRNLSWPLISMHVDQTGTLFGIKGWRTGEHFIQNYSETVNVSFDASTFTRKLIGREIPKRIDGGIDQKLI